MSNSSGEDPRAPGDETPDAAREHGDEPPPPADEQTQPLGYWEQQAQGQPAPAGPAQPPRGQPPYGQPPYGQAPYGYYPPPPPKHDGATTALVLGIVGLVVCQLASPIAWWYGKKTMNEIEASGGRLDGYGEAKAGWICGIIGSALIGIALAFFLVFLVLVAVVGVAAGT